MSKQKSKQSHHHKLNVVKQCEHNEIEISSLIDAIYMVIDRYASRKGGLTTAEIVGSIECAKLEFLGNCDD